MINKIKIQNFKLHIYRLFSCQRDVCESGIVISGIGKSKHHILDGTMPALQWCKVPGRHHMGEKCDERGSNYINRGKEKVRKQTFS